MCPLVCLVKVTIDDSGDIIAIVNNLCKEGRKYTIAGSKFPSCILTPTVLTENSPIKLLPVRTNQPIPKRDSWRPFALSPE